MKKLLLFTLVGIVASTASHAQFSEFQNNIGTSPFTLSTDNNTLEIGGRASFFYENRLLKPGQNYNKMDHNGFRVKDAELDMMGKTVNKFTYELQLSINDLVTAAASNNTNDPGNPGIKAAYVQYRGLPVHIKLGYDKLPFSQGSMSDIYSTPMWNHGDLYGGDLFARRDLGLTLQSRLWKNRINIYGGIYSGMGENIFQYGNDASGRFEYIGRVEFSYPGKMKYHIIDHENSPAIQFRVAVNARYEDKTQPAGVSIMTDYPAMPGKFGIRMINGKRAVYGADAIVKFKGISATFETDMVRMQPSSDTDPLYYGTPASFNGKYVNAGGYNTSLNYNWEKMHSVFSVMYEEFNTNDLAVNINPRHLAGLQAWLYFGYAYKINGFNSVFKVEYYRPTIEAANLNPLKYDGQIRMGYQLVF